jgi:hypothetical protein
MMKDKLKKIRGRIQFLAIIDQPAIKKRKTTTASINPKSKKQILRLTDQTKFINLIFRDD